MIRMTSKSSDKKETPQKIHPSTSSLQKKSIWCCALCPSKILNPLWGDFFSHRQVWLHLKQNPEYHGQAVFVLPSDPVKVAAGNGRVTVQLATGKRLVTKESNLRDKPPEVKTSEKNDLQRKKTTKIREKNIFEPQVRWKKKHKKSHKSKIADPTWRGKIPATFLCCT